MTLNRIIRAPSLDVINRTYRNIEIAADYQARQVAKLTSRLKKQKLSSTPRSSSPFSRDSRITDPKRPYNATPSVVVNAVNALNGEVSAQRLKRALLCVRQKPLLNTKAVTISAPVAFTTPQKLIKAEPQTSLGLSSPSPAMQTWNPTMEGETPSHEYSPRRREKGNKKHASSFKAKKYPSVSPSISGSAPSPSFDWGPLPTIPQTKKLPVPFNVNQSPAPSK